MIYRYTYLVIPTEGKTFFGKVYFGQHTTTNLDDGYICSSTLLRNYLKKYPDGYYREIIAYYDTQEELNQAEYELIHPHLNQPYCLNLREGGEVFVLSDESKQKRKKSLTGRSAWNKGKHCTEEHKNNISKACKGKKMSEEFKEKQRLSHIGLNTWTKGTKRTPESKKKQGETIKGHPGYMKGKKQTEEMKNKLSNSIKGHPGYMKGKHHSKETKKKQSEAHKGKPSPIKGKHKVYDNKELNIYHYE